MYRNIFSKQKIVEVLFVLIVIFLIPVNTWAACSWNGNTGTAASILTTALTEAYAADGATATLSQLLYMIWSGVAQFSISGTTITCKKLDVQQQA